MEQGNLFILQLNKGMHSAYASVNMAVAMVKEKLITEREAIVRLNAKQLDYYMKPQLNLLNRKLLFYFPYYPLIAAYTFLLKRILAM